MTTPRRLICDYEDGVEYTHEFFECMNDATCVMFFNDPVMDEEESYSKTGVLLSCDDHAPEMLHEMKQCIGPGEFLMTANLCNVTDRSGS